MIRFSAHLGYQFNEVDFKDRFELAQRFGYRDVEFPNPYVMEKEDIAGLLDKYALKLIQFGTPMGNTNEKGFAAMPGRSREFRFSLEKAISYARYLDCRMIHPMAGCDTIESKTQWQAYLGNMRVCAELFADNDLTVLLEVMSLPTVKGYFLNSFELYSALQHEIGQPNIGLLFDTWHAQIIYGDIFEPLEKYFEQIKHIQISDYPGRHEPGTGNLDFPRFFQILDEKDYQGHVGCEYKPLNSTSTSLNFMKVYQKEKL
ncbi:hydroxypyruvate isomerase family protein [Klebsiella pneumoniae]|uniref:hydroxypyruvate isomerase family protein n=1 Tax=Klebsiella pneumoniae TaxID=573 RepID=UPI0009BA1149|nr:TIM barrel protein [Klebsiella pneumoniae]SLY87266.1 hydroxypyruvate isomerase [Klebsiella pneumoniae]